MQPWQESGKGNQKSVVHVIKYGDCLGGETGENGNNIFFHGRSEIGKSESVGVGS